MDHFLFFVRSLAIGGCVLLRASQATQAVTPTRQSSLKDTLEAERYSGLPPTVFAPGGRLHGVERVAREALSVSNEDGADGDEDTSSCGLLALHCGLDGEAGDEFGVMVGIGAISPFLHRDETYLGPRRDDAAPYVPLAIDEPESIGGSTPISILSPTLVVGAGGKAIDARLQLRRAQEVALSLYSRDSGGLEWFVAHSLEGTTGTPSSLAGGAAGVDATTLARRVADMAQSSTQSLGGKHGRMLSSSLLALGTRCAPFNHPEGLTNDSSDSDNLVLWRVDPTGQFWRVNAAAVGRGATHVEAELLRRVRRWREERRAAQHCAESEEDICHDDVREFLGNMSVGEAVEVARDCLVNGLLKEQRTQQRQHLAKDGKEDVMKQLEQGLRQRIQAVITQPPSKKGFGPMKKSVAIV